MLFLFILHENIYICSKANVYFCIPILCIFNFHRSPMKTMACALFLTAMEILQNRSAIVFIHLFVSEGQVKYSLVIFK